MPVEDNLDEVAAMLVELPGLIDFTSPGKDGALGKQLLGVPIEGIVDRNRAEVDPDGNPWPENRGKYGERKRDRSLPVGVGLRDGGEMLSQEQIAGQQEITPEEAIARYGLGEEARRKAQWFTNGGSGTDGEPSGAANQPPRRFYEMSDEDADRILDEADAFLRDWINRA